ncbi:MAG: TIGR01459 family HAD-type hydrolase [Pseudomonadota bacterium]
MSLRSIEYLDELTDQYDLIACDVWGVIHNGEASFPDAAAALMKARTAGKCVVLITNSPRPAPGVVDQLNGLNVSQAAFDGIVTSGDVTRTLITANDRRVFHLGPERDLALFEGLNVELVAEGDAGSVVCTGLVDDETETPSDYADLLDRLQHRGVPFICANPDIVVERGDRLLYCAGALARDYAELGGKTLIAGKPHTPIYERVFTVAKKLMGSEVDKSRVLAIGDGVTTDVKGANDAGLDLLFVTNGIHAREYGEPGKPEVAHVEQFLADHGASATAMTVRLA